jgi:ferrochelatase
MAALEKKLSGTIIAPHRKTAIVLFNLGGPDSGAAVQPFLFNLFNDPAIIGVPNPMRWLLAKLISKKRAPTAREIYNQIGGKSPILENTALQAEALEKELNKNGNAKVFIAMRYWLPFADETARAVKKFAPDHIILLPLYPQFSTTTTGSSFKNWDAAAKKAELHVPTSRICCYPTHEKYIDAHVALIKNHYEEAKKYGTPRLLFSAHGLPEKIINAGDPYQKQVEATTQAIVLKLAIANIDYVNCYQSRVGPLKWIGPATTDELERAGHDGAVAVLIPIAFVSEHSETLVELDIEYAHHAKEHGVKHYVRVPTLSVDATFVEALADICLNLNQDVTIQPAVGWSGCEIACKKCPSQCTSPREEQRIAA